MRRQGLERELIRVPAPAGISPAGDEFLTGSNLLRLWPVNPHFSEFFRSFNQAALPAGLFITVGRAGRQAIDRL
jgi:hypothetical protein